MNPVKIFTDSTASLSEDLINTYNISIVPLYVIFDDASYKDGIEINEKELYELVEKKKKLPKTAAASPADYIDAFKPWVDKGYDIIYIGISSYFSSTVQNARIASKNFLNGRVYVIDSLNLSSGIGLLVLMASELAMKGVDAKTIYEKVSATVPLVRSSFIIDTLKFLYMGGRCSSLARWMSSIFSIHPRIIVNDGKMTVGEKFSGKRTAVLNGLLKTALIKKDKIDPHRIFITHSFSSKEDIEYIKDGLQKAISPDEILVTDAGCVIASHCGKKTIGILYIEKAQNS
jgi:DegV family protein with EDD domain